MSIKELMVIAKQKYDDLTENKAKPEAINAGTQTNNHAASHRTDDSDDEAAAPPKSVYAVRSPLDSLPGRPIK